MSLYRGIERRGRVWEWPLHDQKLVAVFDWVDDLAHVLPHVTGRGLCIQAGGACGVWPWYLAQHFEQVITFEPHPVNFACLERNVPANVTAYHKGLSDSYHRAGITVDDFEADNCGAYYLTEGDAVECMTIDMLFAAPDLIQLDIEGGELAALKGGAYTLDKHRPVVVLEEKPLPQIDDHLAPRRWLQDLGYKEVGRVHRDVIFAC